MRAVKQLTGDRRWQRRTHPARVCPVCQAPAGAHCRTPSGRWCEDHEERGK